MTRMDDEFLDQQPIQRVVGKRRKPPVGDLPSAKARAGLAAMAGYRTFAPKGIYFYFSHSSHGEMARDRERWTVAAVVANARAQCGKPDGQVLRAATEQIKNET